MQARAPMKAGITAHASMNGALLPLGTLWLALTVRGASERYSGEIKVPARWQMPAGPRGWGAGGKTSSNLVGRGLLPRAEFLPSLHGLISVGPLLVPKNCVFPNTHAH